MELTPGQQRLLFVVVVLALAGLGIFLIGGRHPGATAAPGPSPTALPPTALPPAAASPATGAGPASASAGVPPATVPPAPPPATTAAGANIYEWLPFSQADLTAAAKTTLAFAGDYATWSYTESKAAYGAKLAGVATAQEIATLAYDQYGTAGVAGPMIQDKQVSTGSGTIAAISAFGPTSITFSVAIAQKLVSTTGSKTSTPTYAVTTVSTGSGWQVDNIQLSTTGNQ